MKSRGEALIQSLFLFYLYFQFSKEDFMNTLKKYFWLFVYGLVMTVVMLLCTIWEILRFGHPIVMLKEAARIVYDHYEELRAKLDEG